MYKCTNTQIHKCANAETHKFTNAQIHKYTNAQTQKRTKFNASVYLMMAGWKMMVCNWAAACIRSPDENLPFGTKSRSLPMHVQIILHLVWSSTGKSKLYEHSTTSRGWFNPLGRFSRRQTICNALELTRERSCSQIAVVVSVGPSSAQRDSVMFVASLNHPTMESRTYLNFTTSDKLHQNLSRCSRNLYVSCSNAVRLGNCNLCLTTSADNDTAHVGLELLWGW